MNPDKFDEFFRKELEETPFPSETLDDDVRFYFPVILVSFSLMQLQCDLRTYKSLVEAAETGEYNLYNISFLLNGMAALRPNDLDLSSENYAALLKDTEAMSAVWNDMVKPIRTKLMSKLQTQHALQTPNGNKLVNPGLRRN